MAVRLQLLEGGASSGGSLIYEVESGVVVQIDSIYVMNPTAATLTFRLAVSPLGTTIVDPDHYLYYDVPVKSKQTRVLSPLTISGGDRVQFEDPTNTLIIQFFGKSLV